MDGLFDGSDAHLLVMCPKCGRQWMPPCEQTICIERHGECIPCRFVPVGGEINKHGSGEGTKEEIDAISSAAKVGAGETVNNAPAKRAAESGSALGAELGGAGEEK